ncbi:putative Potassium voltage-gated channel subfamily KQT; potassium channel, VIC family [Vibrio chagasii]|nr:putative Potassium voltage-gated channel subfamily KQT; potassium channel, VIC family [Vibrio chagasii]
MFIFVILSIACYMASTLNTLTEQQQLIASSIEIICITVFAFEYIYLTFKKKLNYVFSIYGAIDLLTFVPFFLTSGFDLRTLKLIKLGRMFLTIQKSLNDTKTSSLLFRAIYNIRSDLILFTYISISIMLFFALGIYHFENEIQPEVFSSAFDAIWFSSITLTTVGYGDMLPISVGGKVLTALLSFLGIGIVTVPSGLIAASLIKTKGN